jgi:hypothetical protein
MTESMRKAVSKRSDFYAAKQFFSLKFLEDQEARQSERLSSLYSPNWNVVAVGIGPKIVHGKSTSTPCIKFLVRSKASEREVGMNSIIPFEWEGLPTDIEEVGSVRFLSDYTENPRDQIDPIQPGCSIGFVAPDEIRNAGTLSAFVSNEEGQIFLLSNYHVLVDLSNPAEMYRISQPGSFDQDSPRRIGSFVRGIAPTIGITNYIDAALAEIDTGLNIKPDIIGIGTITGIKSAQYPMIVEKFGRGTEYEQGMVINKFWNTALPVGESEAIYRDQIAIKGVHGRPFADSGDSGALVLDAQRNKAVGLLFAQAGTYSFANHISLVLSKLSVTLIQ